MKKILFALALLLTIGAIDAMAQSNPPLSNKRIRMKGQAAAPTPDPPTGYYNLWVDSASGNLYITNDAGTDTPVGAGITGLTAAVIPAVATGGSSLEDSKMTTSGGSKGTWTLYDNGGTGITRLVVRGGASQAEHGRMLDFKDSGDSSIGGVNYIVGGTWARFSTLSDPAITKFYLSGSDNVLRGSSGFHLQFTNAASDIHAATPDSGILRDGDGILRVTDGSTGQGGIGIADSATNTVSDALILRHATSGTAAASFGTGLLFQGEDAAGNMQDMASIDAVYTDATNGSEDSKFVFSTIVGGAMTQIATLHKNALTNDELLFVSYGQINVTTGDLRLTAPGGVLLGSWEWNSSTGSFGPSYDNAYTLGSSTQKITTAYVSTSIQGTRTQAITDNAAAATFVTIAVPTSNTTVGGRIFYTITAIDAGTAIQTKTGTYSFGLNNIGGTVTGAGTDVLEHSQLSVGTLAPTFSVNISGTNAQFQLVLDTSLDAGAETLKIEYRVQIDSGTATVTPAT